MPVSLLAAAKTVPDVSVGHALLQMVLALAVIVASIVVLTKFLARLRNGSRTPSKAKAKATEGLTVLSRQSLGKDLSIATVRWNGREVLVGISGSTITFMNDGRPDTAPPAPGAPAASFPVFATEEPSPLPPALLAAVRSGAVPALLPAPERPRPSLLEQLRDATLRR